MQTLRTILRSAIVVATLTAVAFCLCIIFKLDQPGAMVEALHAQPLFGVSVVLLTLAGVCAWIRLK